MPDQQRHHPRYKAQLEVHFKSASTFVQEYSENVSQGGLFVRTEEPLEVGDVVRLKITLPGGSRQLLVEGSVAHRNPPLASQNGHGPVAGMGVEFVELSVEDREALAVFVKSLSGQEEK